MQARSNLGIVFFGLVVGLLVVLILLVVPVFGIRKTAARMVLNWQEMTLYATCLMTSLLAGPKLVVLMKSLGAEGNDQESNDNVGSESETGEEDAESEPVELVDADDLPLLTEPVIEESLAGGPKKPKHRFHLSEEGKTRSKILAVVLYLVLYVNCAALCQKIKLGSIVTGPAEGELLRSTGLTISVIGLYLIVRGLYRRARAANGIASGDAQEQPFQGEVRNLIPHIPPTRLAFLKAHPVCTGWVILLTGLPLVFQAWFPLMAIPGIFVAMNWFFPDRKVLLARNS